MKTLEYTVRFLTPAFMGDAEQKGQWRTPPFKALLRQWWRVAYATEKKFAVDIAEMRRQEGQLFGHAWLESDQDNAGNKAAARKSQVRIRLNSSQGDAWASGSQDGIKPLPKSDTSYAWFGLINRGVNIPDRMGIKAAAPAESVRQLNLAFPSEQDARIQEVMSLIHDFGLLGSRSRGSWGALHIDNTPSLPAEALQLYARDLAACLRDDWAMSLAKDDKGVLVWESSTSFDTWDKAMKSIAGYRPQVRKSLNKGLRPALGFVERNSRMPSPLRWKVTAKEAGRLYLRVFALPHRIPANPDVCLSEQDLQSAWSTVISTLDGIPDLQRLR